MRTRERGPLGLNGGNWAKQYFTVDKPGWELKRTESAGYPFEGTVTIRYYRYATLYQKSKDLAEKDEDFYLTDGENFFGRPEPSSTSSGRQTDWYTTLHGGSSHEKPDPSTYSSGRKTTLTIQFVYDPDSGWKERSRKVE